MRSRAANLSLVPVKSEKEYTFGKGTKVQGVCRFGRGKNTRYYVLLLDKGQFSTSVQLEVGKI